MKRILLVLGVLWAATSLSAQNLVTGEKAPDLKVAEWLVGKSRLRSGYPTFVEFFFSRSEPSLRRLAVLDGFVRDHKGRLNVILLAREPKQTIADLLEGKGYAFAVALDDEARTFTAYGVQFVPFGVLFDNRGKVVWFGNSSKFGDDSLKESLGWK